MRLRLGFIIRTLLDVRYRIKPSYPEGDLVRVDEVFWLNNNYGVPITEMDHRIDQMSDKIIKQYKNQGHLWTLTAMMQIISNSMPGNVSSS